MTQIKLYRPSNGTEGHMFRAEFCQRCEHDHDFDNPCPIMMATMVFDTDDAEYPNEWRYVDDKETCTKFEIRLTESERETKAQAEAGQMTMFEGRQ